MTSLQLRPLFRASKPTLAFVNRATKNVSAALSGTRFMSTQSSGDTMPPSAIANIHLEDGTTLTGRSFGAHTNVEGEVRT